MKKRTHSIGKAAIIRCLSVAAILTAAVFSGCTPDSPEKDDPDNPREELDEGSIKINVSGGGELGDYTTKAAASREARYTVTGRVISGNGAGIEDETFEVVVTPNEGPTGFMPATRASYGAVQADGGKKTETIRWDEGDMVSVFSDVGKHNQTYSNSGSIKNISYCNYDVKEEQTAEGYTATATPVAAAPFNGSGLKWDKGKAHRFIGIWPPVDTIATLAEANIEADLLELRFNVGQPSAQTAKLDANISNESVYRPDLGSVMMYSGLSVAADKAVASTDVDLLFRPAFTSLEFALLKQDDPKSMTLQKVTVSSQEDILACKSGQKFTGVISQDANASGNNGTTFTIDATLLSESTGSKSIDLTFLNASGAAFTPELDATKPTKFCILALPHQIGTLTIFLELKVDGEDVVRQLDLRVNKNGVKKWIEIPACSKVVISNLTIPTSVTKGLVQKPFSVSPVKKVYFSPGNLQAKLNGSGVAAQWRFAPSQYDVVAKYKEAADNSNTNVANGTGWVDLFGWSGKRNKSSGTPKTTWGIRTTLTESHYKGPFKNWGNNPDIQTAMGNGWDLLTQYEVEYLLNERPNAADLKALATVGDITGIVILPDNWDIPKHCTFTATSFDSGDYTKNKYSIAGTPGTSGSWTAMEQAGAVFFPNTGIGDNTGTYISSTTYYQTSSYYEATLGSDTRNVTSYYSWGSASLNNIQSSVCGLPVRLSKSTAPKADVGPIDYTGDGVTPAAYPFTVNIQSGQTVQFTTSNLMWDGNTARFRLMNNPWSIIEAFGTALPINRSISENIGLFKWGTGGGNKIWPWTTSTNYSEFVTIYPGWSDWKSDRAFGRYWDWGDNEVYDSTGEQMCAERANTRLRTLSISEWHTLLFLRTVTYARYSFAKVAGVEGLIIFPDNYTHPNEVSAINNNHKNQDPSTINWFSTSGNPAIRKYAIISETDWGYMAQNGATFLPAAGCTDRDLDVSNKVMCATGATSSGTGGAPNCFYWTSTLSDKSDEAICLTSLSWGSEDNLLSPAVKKYHFMAVRLVYENLYETRSWIYP